MKKCSFPGGKDKDRLFHSSRCVGETGTGASDRGFCLEYRTLAKQIHLCRWSGYLYCSDGRIHSTFNQTITATGRISSTGTEPSNIPVPYGTGADDPEGLVPKPGCVFVDADYSQIELRVLAHLSRDERLIQAYRDAEDIHRITASQVFHIPFDEVTPLQRRNAKAVNFGIVYGISSFGLSQDLSIQPEEGFEYIENILKPIRGSRASWTRGKMRKRMVM